MGTSQLDYSSLSTDEIAQHKAEFKKRLQHKYRLLLNFDCKNIDIGLNKDLIKELFSMSPAKEIRNIC